MDTNLEAELVRVHHSDTHRCSVFIHCLNCNHYPKWHSSTPSLLITHQRTFLDTLCQQKQNRGVKHWPRCFSCNWRIMKIPFVVPRPRIKPDCIILISTWDLVTLSRTISISFITWFCIFKPLILPLEIASPLPLSKLTI